MPEENPNLFEFAVVTVAESGTGATKVHKAARLGYAGLIAFQLLEHSEPVISRSTWKDFRNKRKNSLIVSTFKLRLRLHACPLFFFKRAVAPS